MTAPGTRPGPFRSGLLNDAVVVTLAALIALRLGLEPIKDNSAFTHLATGIEMVAKGWLPSIPRVDPYTYTALGRDWVVQSWLPAWLVGIGERAFGMHAVLLMSGVATGVVGWLTASLARTGSALRTALIVALTFAVANFFWAPRPLMLGLICLGLTVMVAERKWSPWWLLPIGWVWVQSHGSFPLGVAFLGALWLGTVLSARDRRAGRDELRLTGALALGVLVGAVNPLGPKLLLFPLTAVTKREVFSHIVEWKPLGFATTESALAIVVITIAAAVCIRRRVTPRVAVPFVLFVLLAFSAQRNVAALLIVMAWALGHALRVEGDDAAPVHLDRVLGAAMAVLAGVFVVTAVGEPAINTRPYPVAAIRWAERHGRFAEPHRVLSKDFVGNYLELRHGPSGDVFIDDRFDMFPAAVPNAYFDLLHDEGKPLATLDRYDVDTVIWPRDDDLTKRLRRNGWRVTFSQQLGEVWVVLIRS